MKALLAAMALLMPVAATAAPTVEHGVYTLARTSVLSVSAADGHAYRVLVAWPEGKPPASGWRVLTVLDGEDNFALVTQTLRRLAKAGARSGVEDAVVVAVESGSLARRVRDYTPATPGWVIPAGSPAAGLQTGGADAFLDFLANRLRPEIERRWPGVGPRQALLGHSFGGLLGLHAYLTRPDMFDTIVAVSPSLWFGGDLLAREEAAHKVNPAAKILLAEGSDARRIGNAPDEASALAARLNRSGATARFLSLPQQTHGSSMLAALVPALQFTAGSVR